MLLVRTSLPPLDRYYFFQAFNFLLNIFFRLNPTHHKTYFATKIRSRKSPYFATKKRSTLSTSSTSLTRIISLFFIFIFKPDTISKQVTINIQYFNWSTLSPHKRRILSTKNRCETWIPSSKTSIYLLVNWVILQFNKILDLVLGIVMILAEVDDLAKSYQPLLRFWTLFKLATYVVWNYLGVKN